MHTFKQIEVFGDTWNVLALGARDNEGKVYAHLASTTRFVEQRNGKRPIQIGDWIDASLVA